MTGRECTDLRQSIGVYVLGAIDPAERAELDAHLAGCQACRDELAGLAGLPALLGRVSEEQLHATAHPGDALLDRILAQVGTARRRARRRILFVAAAAAAVLVVGLAGGAVGLLRAGTPDARGTPASPPAAAPAPSASASDPRSGVAGAVALAPKAWGTAVTARLSGLPYNSRCSLVAVGRGGQQDVAASWTVTYYREDAVFNGSTGIDPDELTQFEVVTDDGERLLTIPIK